eukprot:scaffold33987_cov124-Isochrysis_galbana.AAC.2
MTPSRNPSRGLSRSTSRPSRTAGPRPPPRRRPYRPQAPDRAAPTCRPPAQPPRRKWGRETSPGRRGSRSRSRTRPGVGLASIRSPGRPGSATGIAPVPCAGSTAPQHLQWTGGRKIRCRCPGAWAGVWRASRRPGRVPCGCSSPTTRDAPPMPTQPACPAGNWCARQQSAPGVRACCQAGGARPGLASGEGASPSHRGPPRAAAEVQQVVHVHALLVQGLKEQVEPALRREPGGEEADQVTVQVQPVLVHHGLVELGHHRGGERVGQRRVVLGVIGQQQHALGQKEAGSGGRARWGGLAGPAAAIFGLDVRERRVVGLVESEALELAQLRRRDDAGHARMKER